MTFILYITTIVYGRHLNLGDCYEGSSSQSGWLLRTVVISIWLTVTNGRHLDLVDCYERSSSQSGWLLRNTHISNDNGYFILYVDILFPLSLPRLLQDLTVYIGKTAGVL